MSKLIKKCNFMLSQGEYVKGQTWCFMKKRHVCFYVTILFCIGVIYEAKSILINKEVSPALMMSVLALVIYALTKFRVNQRFIAEYRNEHKNWEVIFENQRLLIKNDIMQEGIFFEYKMINKIYRKYGLYIIYLNKYQTFFIPCHAENAKEFEKQYKGKYKI